MATALIPLVLTAIILLVTLQEVFRLVDRLGFNGVRPAGVNDTGSA